MLQIKCLLCSSAVRECRSNSRHRKCNLKTLKRSRATRTHRCMAGQLCVCAFDKKRREARLQLVSFFKTKLRGAPLKGMTVTDHEHSMWPEKKSVHVVTGAHLQHKDWHLTKFPSYTKTELRPSYSAGLHMATEASESFGRLCTTCSSCPESETS